MGTPDQEVVEGHREGPRVEASQSPFGQVVMEGEVDRGGSGLLGQHESGVSGRGESCQKRRPVRLRGTKVKRGGQAHR